VTLFRGFIPEPPERVNAPDRLPLSSDALFPILTDMVDEIDELRQVRLLRESDFVNWSRHRGMPITAIIKDTEAATLWKRGWLRADRIELEPRSNRARLEAKGNAVPVAATQAIGIRPQSPGRRSRHALHFHPFRSYPAARTLEVMQWNLVRTNALYGPGVRRFADEYLRRFRRLLRQPQFTANVSQWNGIADLAIMLEPVYWPAITSVLHTSVPETEGRQALAEAYKAKALGVLDRIPKAAVAAAHMDLRTQGGLLDENDELYLVLRTSNWRTRERLKGRIGMALWWRHMAETIRLGYDELYEDRLVHEDEAFGFWRPGARAWAYGSEYPLDDPREIQKRLLPRMGIHSGVLARFYVEGDTEEGALRAGLAGAIGYVVDVVNLKAKGWRDWLPQELRNDQKAKRFSLLMLDADREDTVRAVKRHAQDNLIVGMVFLNKPDLEMGCFTVEQLCRAAEEYEQLLGSQPAAPLDPLLFQGVTNGAEFETRYSELRHTRGLKGATWGEALAHVAFSDRTAPSDEGNPLVHAIMCAHRAASTDYEAQSRIQRVNPNTLESESTGLSAFEQADGGR
jgi:hypothetical protein